MRRGRRELSECGGINSGGQAGQGSATKSIKSCISQACGKRPATSGLACVAEGSRRASRLSRLVWGAICMRARSLDSSYVLMPRLSRTLRTMSGFSAIALGSTAKEWIFEVPSSFMTYWAMPGRHAEPSSWARLTRVH